MEEKKVKRYRCLLCGYEVEFEGEMPDDYVCPVCGATKDQFEEIE